MGSRLQVLLVVQLLFLSACSPEPVFRLAPEQGPTTFYKGVEYLTLEQDSIAVTLAYYRHSGDMFAMDIEVANYSNTPVRVNPANFGAIAMREYTDSVFTDFITHNWAYDPEIQLLEIDKMISKNKASQKTEEVLFLTSVGLGVTAALLSDSDEKGNEIIPRRSFRYDTLILAVGSVSNDFSIEGVREHCLFLDTKQQAEDFQHLLLENFMHASTQPQPLKPGQLDVVIAGGGATGIELSAQLHKVSRLITAYGIDQINPADVKITIVEAAERILPGLPPRLSRATEAELDKLNIAVLKNERVVKVTGNSLFTQSGREIHARLKVWAAGIKAPDFLSQLEGLETNRSNQLLVERSLQTTNDENIFAFGDCAACPWPEKDSIVPPRAQSAHQQASLLVKSMKARLAGKPLPKFVYRDYGSLVSLGKYSTVGNLMGNLTGSVMVEGFIARMVYLSLYKLHQLALFGFYRTMMLSIAHLFRATVEPEIKLH